MINACFWSGAYVLVYPECTHNSFTNAVTMTHDRYAYYTYRSITGHRIRLSIGATVDNFH